jgi:hypothetical protein
LAYSGAKESQATNVMTLTKVGDLVVGNSQRQLFLPMACLADIPPYSLEKSISYLGEEHNNLFFHTLLGMHASVCAAMRQWCVS